MHIDINMNHRKLSYPTHFFKHPVTSQHIARTHQYFTRKRRLNGLPNLRVDPKTPPMFKAPCTDDLTFPQYGIIWYYMVSWHYRGGPFCSSWIVLQSRCNILRFVFSSRVQTVKQNAPLKFPLVHQAVAMLAPHLHMTGKCSKGVNPHVKWSSASTPIDEKSVSIDWVDSVRFTRCEIPWNSYSKTTSLCMHQNSSVGNLIKRHLFILITCMHFHTN